LHEALTELEREFCATLRHNRPAWNVREGDLKGFNGRSYKGIDLLAGGLLSRPEQDCIAFRSKDASMIPARMPSSTGLFGGRQVGVRSS
jgi:hypothetical protein